MNLYRVANKKFLNSTLSGIGAEKYGGRWNAVGTRAVYCSENISLALLEYYIHSSDISKLPKEILLAKIYVPDELMIEELPELPKNWNSYPYGANSSKIFSKLANSRDFFAIKVPSSIVFLEYNFVLNPLYKDFGKVEILEFIDLKIDKRLKSAKHQ